MERDFPATEDPVRMKQKDFDEELQALVLEEYRQKARKARLEADRAEFELESVKTAAKELQEALRDLLKAKGPNPWVS